MHAAAKSECAMKVSWKQSVVRDPVTIIRRPQFTEHQKYDVNDPPDTDTTECQQLADSRTYNTTNKWRRFPLERQKQISGLFSSINTRKSWPIVLLFTAF